MADEGQVGVQDQARTFFHAALRTAGGVLDGLFFPARRFTGVALLFYLHPLLI